MKQQFSLPVTITVLSLILCVLSSCSAIEGIFKAGIWAGIFFVVAIIAVIIFIISRIGGRK